MVIFGVCCLVLSFIISYFTCKRLIRHGVSYSKVLDHYTDYTSFKGIVYTVFHKPFVWQLKLYYKLID